MTDTPEEEFNENDEIIDELEYRIIFLERTMSMLMIGMDALEESRDRLRAENSRLQSVINMGAKKVH